MYQYSLGLALYDYIPVLLFATGLFYLTKTVRQLAPRFTQAATVGAVLITIAGFIKASWKLVISQGVDGEATIWMSNQLIPMMAAGFTILVYVLWATRREIANNPVKTTAWRCPASAILLVLGASAYLGLTKDGKGWFFIALTMLTVSNFIMAIHAFKLSRSQGTTVAASLFILNFILVLVMSGLGRALPPGESSQWIAQFANTFTQGTLALAAWMLYKQVTEPQSLTTARA
ncbi:hypothetical protein [Paraferrimonas sp. SM1919]|uniref:hypothetical protein n=1 Tax=Paraferrimonas sp. SM1919 TaxID=2662263 RepID=UPI0013D5401D|nr:hypothetical protein [Paraferrimonas sp. SM1919]